MGRGGATEGKPPRGCGPRAAEGSRKTRRPVVLRNQREALAYPSSELLISPRDSSGNVEIELTPNRSCVASGDGVRLGHAAVAVADLPGWYDSHYCRVGLRLSGWESDLPEWASARVSACAGGLARFPAVHQSTGG